MRHKIEIQYKPENSSRPLDYVQEAIIEAEWLAVPNVGDTIDYSEDGKIIARKVLTRHFSFSAPNFIHINLVVTDVSKEEMGARVKE